MERDRLQQLLPQSNRGELPAHYRRNGQSYSDPIWDSKARVTSRYRLAASSKTPLRKGIADRRRAAKSALADGGPRWISFSIIYWGQFESPSHDQAFIFGPGVGRKSAAGR